MVDSADIRANKWWLSGLFIFIVVSSQSSLSDSACQQTGRVSSWTIGNGSLALYDSDEAEWTFKLNLPTNWNDEKQDLFRYFCIKLFLTDSEDWQFYRNETQRQLLTPYFSKSVYNDQVNVSGTFDHVYTGSYELTITSCSSDNYRSSEYQLCQGSDCSSIPFKRVPLCPVKTDRSPKFDATKMNFSIRMDSNEKGIKIDFTEEYKMNDPLLIPFKEFIIELIYKENNTDNHPTLSYKIRTKLKHVEFRNCSNSGNCPTDCYEQDSTTICETILRSGWYSTAVNALDGRCNIRGVNKLGKMKLQELPTTLKVFKSLKDCERIYASDGKLRFLEFPRQTPKEIEVIDKETYGSPWITAPLIGLLVLTALSIMILVMKMKQRRIHRAHQTSISINKNSLNPIGLSNGVKKGQRLLFIYERENENLKEKVSNLRYRLLKSEGVTEVCDYGDEEQEEEINISGIQNWFLERIHDPSVKIIVILSAGLRAHQHMNLNPDLLDHHQKLLVYLMNQLMAVSVATVNHSRIFVLTFDESELPPDDGVWLTPFVRYHIPQHFNQLMEDILLRPANSSIKEI